MGDLAREQAKQRSAALAAVRADQIPDTEMEALRDLYESTSRGKGWRHTYGWDGGEGIAVSTWFGVTVFRRHVTEITLPGNGLDGPLPGTLVHLSKLQVLDLGKNRLTGRIPDAFHAMPDLNDITLGRNQLTGPLPASLFSPTMKPWRTRNIS